MQGLNVDELVAGNTMFALDLYRELSESGNLFFSPYSISAALAMTFAGARGITEEQMAEVLHFGLPQAELHRSFARLNSELDRRGKGARGKGEGEGFRLNIANALWGQKGHEFLSDFLRTLARHYGAELHRVDFSDSEAAREKINTWADHATEGKITEPIPQGLLDKMVRLVLANAVYFNAAWANPFEENATEDGPFYLLDGSTVTVTMMHQVKDLGYGKGKGYQVVELPYDGREISLTIILPEEGKFRSFEESLDAGRLTDIVSTINYRKIDLTMPKVAIDSGFKLSSVLKRMGMPSAFDHTADFRGMDGSTWLKIQEVIHKAVVEWDEAGTEAAAATFVIMRAKGLSPAQPIEVTLDRPFIFLIRDRTGTILFLGRVLNPVK